MKSVAVFVAVCFIQCIAGEPILGLFGGGSRHHASASAHASAHSHGGGGLLGGILPGGDDCDGGLLDGLPVVGGIIGGGGHADAEAHAHSGGGGLLGGILPGGDGCDGGLLDGLPIVGGIIGGGGHADAEAHAHSGGPGHAGADAEAHAHSGGGHAHAEAHAHAHSGGGILGGILGGDSCDGDGGILGSLPIAGGILGGGDCDGDGGILGGIGGGVLGGIGGGILGGCDGGGILGGLGGGVLGGLSGGLLDGGILGGLGGGITSFPKLICQTIGSSVTTITTQVTRYVTITKTVLPIIERLPVISELVPSLECFDQLAQSITPAFNTIGNDADDCSSIIGHGTEISPALQDVHSGVQNLIQTTRDSYSKKTTTTTVVTQVRTQIEVIVRRLFTYVSNCRLTVQNVYDYINHDDCSSPDLSTGLAAIGKLTTGLRTTLQITTQIVQKFTKITNIRSTELIGTTKYLDQVTTTVQTLETSLSRCTSITNVRPVLASVLGDLNDISTGIVSQPCFNVQPDNVCAGPIGPTGVIHQTSQVVSQTTETRTVLQRVITTLGSVSQYIQTQVQQVSTQVTTLNYQTTRTHITSLQNVIYRVLNRFAFLSVHQVQSVYTEVTAYYSQITTIIKSLSTTIDSCDASVLRPHLVVFQQFFQSIVYITQVTYKTFQTVYGRTTVTTTSQTTTITEQRTVQILQDIETRLTAINIGGSPIGGPGGVIIGPNSPDYSTATAAASASSGPHGSTATAVASASSGPHGPHIYPHGPGPVQILDTDDDDQSPTIITGSPDYNDDDDVTVHPILHPRPHHSTATASATASTYSTGPRGHYPSGPGPIIDEDCDDDQPHHTIITGSPDCDDDNVTIQPIIRPRPIIHHGTSSASATATASSGPHGVHVYPHGPGPVQIVDTDDDDQSPTIVTGYPDNDDCDDSYSPIVRPIRPHSHTTATASAVATTSSGPHHGPVIIDDNDSPDCDDDVHIVRPIRPHSHTTATASAVATTSSGPHHGPVIIDDNDSPDCDDDVHIVRPIRPHSHTTATASAVATTSSGPHRGPVIIDDNDDNDYPHHHVIISPHRPTSSATATASASSSDDSPDVYHSSPIGVYPTPDYDDDSPVTILPINRRPSRGTSSATAVATANSDDGTATASATATSEVYGPYATLFNTYRNRLVTGFDTLRQEITTISRTVRTSYDHTIIITKITKVQTLISSLVQYISQLDDNVVHSRICPVTFNSGITAITTMTKEISVTVNEYIQSGNFEQVITKRLYSLVQRVTAYAYYPTYYSTDILRRITSSSVQVTTIVPTVLKNLISTFSSVTSATDTTEYQENGLQPYITGLSSCGDDLAVVPIDTSECNRNQVNHIRGRIASAVEGVHQVRNSFQKLTRNVQLIQQRAAVLASAVSDITQNLSEVTADNEELRQNLDESLNRLQGAISDSDNLGIYNHFASYNGGSSSSASASSSASSDSYGHSSASASASASSSTTHPYHIVLDNGNRFCNTIRHYNRWLPQPLPC